MNKQIINEKNKYSTKDITKWVRQTLKENFPDLKFSVTFSSYSGGSSMSVAVIESKTMRFLKTFEEISETEIRSIANARNDSVEEVKTWIKKVMESTKCDINQYHIESDWQITDQGKKVLKAIMKIVNKHNWDKSDSMIDYFDVNYYVNISLGKWNKPFKDGVQ